MSSQCLIHQLEKLSKPQIKQNTFVTLLKCAVIYVTQAQETPGREAIHNPSCQSVNSFVNSNYLLQ